MSEYSYNNSSAAYAAGAQAQSLDKPRHGASIEISKRNSDHLYHLDRNGSATHPLIRSYSDGIRIGCTFVTNEALKKIHSMHQRYLSKEDYVTHQEPS
jgi:hypothetical protein